MQTVQPWATAATLAQADPDNPHGVLLAPYLVPAVDGSGEVEGFVVAAVFDTNSSEMQVGRSARLFSESPCCRCTLQARWRVPVGLIPSRPLNIVLDIHPQGVHCSLLWPLQAEGDSCKDGGTPVADTQPETASNNTSAPASSGQRLVAAQVVASLLLLLTLWC